MYVYIYIYIYITVLVNFALSIFANITILAHLAKASDIQTVGYGLKPHLDH